MSSHPIMVVTLCVPPEKEVEFSDFYQHSFLTSMLRDCPEILAIRRYEELGTSGTVRWYDKQFLTIYELASDEALENADELFKRSSLADVMREFQQWKANHLTSFSRSSFKPVWEHERTERDGRFGSRPFLLFSAEFNSESEDEFNEWYQDSYLPMQIADVPLWSCCHRYKSVGKDPARYLTFFEAADENNLNRCMKDLRAPHRITANYDWHRRFQAAASWHDTRNFQCIYRRPG